MYKNSFTIISVVGTRPNFIKAAPLLRESLKYDPRIQHLLCHTGQHYDYNMSEVFFTELEMPKPAFFLEVGDGSHAEQTARIMLAFEKVLNEAKPKLVIVYGDVNSTMACTLAAVKLHIPVAHVEAGLRSFDRSMPEEINRLVTDAISGLLLVSEPSGMENLMKEGATSDKVFFTGNIMIDTLVHSLPKIEASEVLSDLHLTPKNYIAVTFHRPSNVDSREDLNHLVEFLNEISKQKKVVFPVHPRTRHNIEKFGLMQLMSPEIIISNPLGYFDFMALVKDSCLVITDSGGIQEESTFLGVQCITVRDNTERPVTVTVGTNHLAGTNLANVLNIALQILSGNEVKGRIPQLWDGHTAERIMTVIDRYLNSGD
ncbi:MAG: UDP-N-acetylglucosamine 2-epimerase (non-hydrolyzing) [Bacteroidota bacterium]